MPTKDANRSSAAAARRRARERAILSATRTLFDERGVRDAQIEDVARAVGVNRAIIYRHFSGKEELFALTLVSYLDELNNELSKIDVTASPTERVAELTSSFVEYGLKYPAFIDCAQTLLRRPGQELLAEISADALFRLGRGVTKCLKNLTSALQAGVDAGQFHIADVDLLGNTLYASGLGAIQMARSAIIVKELAPGIPTVATITPDSVKKYLVASAIALAEATPK